MACGTPVVGAAVGGIKSTVVDGVTGFLVPPGDPRALARKLAVLAQNPMLARALGRGGIRRARSLYTWERVTEQLLRVYVDVVKSSQSTIARPRNLVALPRARR
jgi:glycosyltransferase involved in cell wall biosynthesis